LSNKNFFRKIIKKKIIIDSNSRKKIERRKHMSDILDFSEIAMLPESILTEYNETLSKLTKDLTKKIKLFERLGNDLTKKAENLEKIQLENEEKMNEILEAFDKQQSKTAVMLKETKDTLGTILQVQEGLKDKRRHIINQNQELPFFTADHDTEAEEMMKHKKENQQERIEDETKKDELSEFTEAPSEPTKKKNFTELKQANEKLWQSIE